MKVKIGKLYGENFTKGMEVLRKREIMLVGDADKLDRCYKAYSFLAANGYRVPSTFELYVLLRDTENHMYGDVHEDVNEKGKLFYREQKYADEFTAMEKQLEAREEKGFEKSLDER